MNDLKDFWSKQNRIVKMILLIAVLATIVLPLALIFYIYDENYAPLYDGLGQDDAAKITSKLDALKIEYKLDRGGDTILVPSSDADSVRLKMVSEGVLPGSSVGYELFDDLGYGVSDYAQKIQYQRAIQGELERSIMMLHSIKAARVNLVLADEKLFSKDHQKAKASVMLTVHPGVVLEPDQIVGIQTLVASSVKGLEPANVVINDANGILLSSIISENQNKASYLLDEKARIERQLTIKCSQLLDHIFGAGQAMVNVNIALTTSEVNEVKETVITNGATEGTGVLIKTKNSITRKSNSSNKDNKQDGLTTIQEDSENIYQTGKLVETKIRKPGEIAKISLSAIVPESATKEQLASIAELLSATVGIDLKRGDVIAVERFSVNQSRHVTEIDISPEAVIDKSIQYNPLLHERIIDSLVSYRYYLIALLVSIFVVAVIYMRRETNLDMVEREQLLLEIKSWLNEDSTLKEGSS